MMTLYKRLFDLKYRKGVPTHELRHRFPEHTDLVSEVALLEIPENTLRKLALEEKILERLMSLKKTIVRDRSLKRKQKSLL